MQTIMKEFSIFKGIKDDADIKDIPLDYFFKITNYNFTDLGITGLEPILMPSRVNQLSTGSVDGMYEYRYLDSNNKLQTEQIGVCNGNIYKNILNTPILLKSGLTTGKCSFAVLNDKLYISNGKDYIYIYDGSKGLVSQMGAPIVEESTLGVISGSYYWAMTYITAGGEEIVGSVSNTLNLTNKRVILNLPLGYDGTTQRKIYRTEAGGTTLKLLTTIADNTTLTYIDNNADITLGAQIGNINNELPKPYFIGVYAERLIGVKCDLLPTQIFITDTEKDIFDVSNSLDIANYADDNSIVEGLGIDFDSIVVGTKRHIYLIQYDTSGNVSVITTRVNIGVKDGYSIKRVPAYGNFQGGMMFVSSNNDVRILSGLRAIPVSTSVDNIYSDNFSQNVNGSLGNALISPQNIYAEYYNYRYYLIVDGNKYVYDIRNNSWTYHDIQTTNYKSYPMVLSIFSEILYNGQNDGWIEQEYSEITYRGEDVVSILESPNISFNDKITFFQYFRFWFIPSENNELELEVIIDNDKYLSEKKTFNFIGGAYSETDYSSAEYAIALEMDFKHYNVHKNIEYIRFILKNTKGNILFKRWGMTFQVISGKE